MANPYSLDLRQRVVGACDAGEQPEKVGPRFSVSVRTIYYWLEKRKKTGDIAPKAASGGCEHKLADYADTLRKLVRTKPDATLAELRSDLPIPVSIGAVWNMLLKLELSFKKKSHSRG